MIDIHCHILPGIDDGAKNMEDAVSMAKMAVKQGITHVLCTPHHKNGTYENPAEAVIKKITELQQELDARNIPLTLLEGQEVRLYGELIADIEREEILFADLSNRYLLIEFPTRSVPSYTEQLFFDLLSKGHVPIIVHPERNYELMQDPNRLASLVSMGALAQLTAASYLGVFGQKIEQASKKMVKNRLVHVLASDAHNVEKRGFYLKKAYAQISKDFGSETVEFFMQTAKDIVNGDAVVVPPVQEVKKKKFRLF